MNKEQILEILQAKNKNLRLPSGMGFSIENKVLTITMEEKGLTANMQTDASAFEGWAICLKAWLPEYISAVKIGGDVLSFPKGEKKTIEERHYNRFLYRLGKFKDIYSWASTTNDFEQEFKKIFKDETNLYINVPRQDASKGATHCEAQLERAFREKNEGSYNALNHQLPVRIFSNKETKEKDAITPGGFIDIWGIKDDCLKIFELKLPVNKEIGIISELMFYVNVMTDLFQHKIAIPRESQYRSFDKLKEFYEKKRCKKIEGVFLADNFHPMIETKKEEVLQIINDGEFVRDPSQLSVFFSFDKPNVKDYCPTHLEINEPKKNMTYKEYQKCKQLCLLKAKDGIFEDAKGCGIFENNMYPYVLQEKDSQKNLYKDIRGNVLKYFDDNNIVWWHAKKGQNMPTGHLLSSQIHCLNHLFALRKGGDVDETKQIIKTIIEKTTKLKIKEVLQCPLDNDGGYITFEFVYRNRTLLHEKHEKRGANCTSIDALVFVETEENKSILVPIEWKYTESYDKKKKADEDVVNERYKDLASRPYSNLNRWKDEYYYDPLYEFARQTLLMEQIIHENPMGSLHDKVHDYIHIIVRPNDNKEICTDIQNFKKDLKNKDKVIEIAPQDLLAPLRDNKKYDGLITYLETRYWK